MTYEKFVYPYPTGDGGRLWKRALELGQGWAEIGSSEYKISLLGEKDLDTKCGCGCSRVYAIRIHDHPQHYAKFQCTKCALQRKWAKPYECEF